MNADIFLHDFDRTENSDALHAIVGRALTIATRFDASCKAASLHNEFRKGSLNPWGEQDRSKLLNEIAEKHRTLNSSIKALKLPHDVTELLYRANVARNSVAHDLAKGMTGCLDIKFDETSFIREVSELMFDIACGDVIISHTIHTLNGDPSQVDESVSSYVERITQWVVEK